MSRKRFPGSTDRSEQNYKNVAEATKVIKYDAVPRTKKIRLTTIHHPIGSWMDKFSTFMISPENLSDTTVNHYMHDLKVFLKYIIRYENKVQTIHDVTAEVIRRYVDHMHFNRQHANATVRRRLSSLNRFFAYLNHIKASKLNPVDAMEKVKDIPPPLVVLTRIEALRLLEASKTTKYPLRDHAVFQLFLTCGCTLSELLALNRADLNLKGRKITFQNRGGTRRTITLSDGCFFALHRHVTQRKNIPFGGALFINRREDRITKGAVYHAFSLIWKRARINKKGITIRSLRNTCIVLHWKAGMTLIQLQQFAGHASLASTRRYTAGRKQAERSASGKPIFPLDLRY